MGFVSQNSEFGFYSGLNGKLLFRHSVLSDSWWPRQLQHARLPCPSLSPGVCSNLCPLHQWSFVVPFSSCVQCSVFPSIRIFASGGQRIGVSASASILPVNIQHWFPLGLTGLTSLQHGIHKSLQYHSSKASILQHSAVLMIQLSHPYRTTEKTIALTCKTQNLGLHSKEEKPRDPINQPSRYNASSPGRQSTPNSKLGKLFICKKNILSAYHIWVTKWLVTRLQSNPIGTNFAGFGSNLKQFYWYKGHGLWFKLRHPRAFTGCILIGRLQVTRWGRGIPPFHGKPKPKSRLPASPSPGSPT